MQSAKVEINSKGLRADNFIMQEFKLPSRSFLQKNWDNIVLINGKVSKPAYKLRLDDEVTIKDDNIETIIKGKSIDNNLEPQLYPLEIVSETDDYLIINKPKGIPVHPGVGNPKDTLANYVIGYLASKNQYDSRIERGGIVHRLDKSVSGLILFAKTLEAQKYFQKQFEEHKVNKIYHAVVDYGKDMNKEIVQFMPEIPLNINSEIDKLISRNFEIDNSWLKMEGYIGRSNANRMKMMFKTYLAGKSKYALSYIKPLNSRELLIIIKTGRMYQIRATLEYLGIHIIGDTLFETVKGGKIPQAIELESILLSAKDMQGNSFIARLK